MGFNERDMVERSSPAPEQRAREADKGEVVMTEAHVIAAADLLSRVDPLLGEREIKIIAQALAEAEAAEQERCVDLVHEQIGGREGALLVAAIRAGGRS